jgi:hypothetical protein
MIYVQSNKEKTLPHHFDAACALYGAIDNGVDYRLTSFEEVESGKFDNLLKTQLFVGSVEFMREVFKRANRTPKPILNTDRDNTIMSVDTLREEIENGKTYFVKPLQQKLFSGLVVDKYSISSLREIPSDTVVLAYDVIYDIISEWRLYVHNYSIVDARNYSGGFKIMPDFGYATNVLNNLKHTLPRTFVMDIGVAADGVRDLNFVVEFNDMYAIGNYGIENSLYYRMLSDRYFDIMRNE